MAVRSSIVIRTSQEADYRRAYIKVAMPKLSHGISQLVLAVIYQAMAFQKKVFGFPVYYCGT
ncbi:hypothetical protein J2S21_000372 [Peribacillus cavernae]|nr:hypothetical protein [Peribacillus cavernae]